MSTDQLRTVRDDDGRIHLIRERPHYILFADGVVIGSRFGDEAARAVVAMLAAKWPDVTFGYCPSQLWSIEQHRLMVEAGERYGLPAISRGE